MARAAVDPLDVPDRLGGVREVVAEEPAAVALGEDAGVAPLVLGELPVDASARLAVEVADVLERLTTTSSRRPGV
jgi:hypothetical protein